VKYMMIVCFDPAIDPADAEGGMDTDAWVAEMDGRGVRLEGRALQPGDATTVRVRGGETLVSDGPFAETKEQVGGFCLIECADLDEAVEVAAMHPAAAYGTIEIRELWPPL
jgi:hypothetical protein